MAVAILSTIDDAPESQQARNTMARVGRALDAAEELRGAFEDLIGAEPTRADYWRLRSVEADRQVRLVRVVLDELRKTSERND